jgi:hypothetical protein
MAGEMKTVFARYSFDCHLERLRGIGKRPDHNTFDAAMKDFSAAAALGPKASELLALRRRIEQLGSNPDNGVNHDN